MRGSWVRIAALLTGACLPVVVAACASDTIVDAQTPTEADAGGDAGTVPEKDATAEEKDAGSDARDAAPDVTTAPKLCSDQGWCRTEVPDTQYLKGVWGDKQGAVWAVSQQGNILRWDGKAWSIARAGTTPLTSIWGSSPTDIWVGGDGGLLHGTGASSTTLTWTAIPLSVPISTVWGTSATNIWTAGYTTVTYRTYNGSLFHYTTGDANDAASWVVDPSIETISGIGKIWGSSETDFWVGGLQGYLAGTPGQANGAFARHHVSDGNGGFTWRPEYFGPSYLFLGGAAISPTQSILLGFGPPNAYATGASTDNGATFAWTSLENGFGVGVAHRAVWSSSPNDVYIASINGWLHHFDGTAWSVSHIATDPVIPVTNDFEDIWGSGPDDVWVVGQDIALHKGSINSL